MSSGSGTGTVAVGGDALFTPGELDLFCNRSFTGAQYTDGHDHAQRLIEDYCQHIFLQRDFTEEVEPDGPVVTLDNWPVTAVASVVASWTDPDEPTEDYTPADYRRRTWGLKFKSTPVGHFLTVAYTAGAPAVPADIKWVALTIAKDRLLPRERPEGVSSLSSDGVNYSFNLAVQGHRYLPNAPTGNDKVDAILNRYRFTKVRAS